MNLIAKATISIKAPSHESLDSLVSPAAVKQYMFGTNVTRTEAGSAMSGRVCGKAVV